VLGKTINEAGEKEGLEVLHMLATSPSYGALYLDQSWRCGFVSDNPPEALVDAWRPAPEVERRHQDGAADDVQLAEFWSTEAYRAKVKTPEEFVISAVRRAGLTVNHPQALCRHWISSACRCTECRRRTDIAGRRKAG